MMMRAIVRVTPELASLGAGVARLLARCILEQRGAVRPLVVLRLLSGVRRCRGLTNLDVGGRRDSLRQLLRSFLLLR